MVSTKNNSTITKTLMTARLFDGFWERWIAHGIEPNVVGRVKLSIKDLDSWVKTFSCDADKHHDIARIFQENEQNQKAEYHYKISGLYYNLAHWIYPDRCDEKVQLYKKSQTLFSKADQLSSIVCSRKIIKIDNRNCTGRIRIPEYPKGCIIIINPIDSTKEELFSYEDQFVKSGFATVSFDGPGQGETFTLNGLKATAKRWESFLDQVISLAYQLLPKVPIHLFGTSSGAAWSIYGGSHPLVDRVVAVSPALGSRVSLPSYFIERLNYILKGNDPILPDLKDLSASQGILLFHGNKDVMVHNEEINQLYRELPEPKRMVEYREEGHCCNNKLPQVRELSMDWFDDKEIN